MSLETLRFPILLRDAAQSVAHNCALLLAQDDEFRDVPAVPDSVIQSLADSLQYPQIPTDGPNPEWRTTVVNLARAQKSVGVVGCQLRYLAAVALGLLEDVSDTEQLEAANRLHWAVYFGLEVAARTAADELSREAFHSEVTSLRNKRRFRLDITRWVEEGKTPYLSYIDMDGLKAINDIHGHEEGDKALRELASFISEFLGADDVGYHFSGDEFGVVSTGGSEEELRATMNLIRDRSNRKFSFGTTQWQDGDEVAAWQQRADEAMQLEKQARKESGDAPPRGTHPNTDE